MALDVSGLCAAEGGLCPVLTPGNSCNSLCWVCFGRCSRLSSPPARTCCPRGGSSASPRTSFSRSSLAVPSSPLPFGCSLCLSGFKDLFCSIGSPMGVCFKEGKCQEVQLKNSKLILCGTRSPWIWGFVGWLQVWVVMEEIHSPAHGFTSAFGLWF